MMRRIEEKEEEGNKGKDEKKENEESEKVITKEDGEKVKRMIITASFLNIFHFPFLIFHSVE